MRAFFFILTILLSISAKSQTDNAGSGRALLFDGVDDYIDFGNVYHDLNLPFTISAWVYLDPSSGAAPIFTSNDNDQIYRGFWFFISPTALWCEFGDGKGGNNPAFRRGKIANLSNNTGRWFHVCAVVRGSFDIDLYVNGINVGGDSSGDSNSAMASSFPGDIVKTAYFEANGGVIYHYKGMIDEIRLWNRSLTQDEVRQGMCKKLMGNEPGLIGYWNFDETTGNIVSDKSPNGFNGQIMGGATRIYSGAPIGNDSKYLYASAWSGTNIALQDNDDLLTINNIKGSPEGVHLYEVKNLPSQTDGLSATEISQPYFGVFAASLHVGNSFDATYTYKGSSSCGAKARSDNSIANWTSSNNPATNVSQRIELLKASGAKASLDLGPDKIVCNQTSITLSTGISDPQFSILWSTGEVTPSINVTQSGTYSVNVSGICGSQMDNIKVLIESNPPSISLGLDQASCEFKPTTLTPLIDPTGYQFLWQNNSTGPSFQVDDFGKYWVTIKNDCGQVSDTVTFTKYKRLVNFVPNVITPNGDELNQYFKIDEEVKGSVSVLVLNRWGKQVYQSSSYQNDWDGGDLSSGTYYVVINGGCINEVKSWLTIIH